MSVLNISKTWSQQWYTKGEWFVTALICLLVLGMVCVPFKDVCTYPTPREGEQQRWTQRSQTDELQKFVEGSCQIKPEYWLFDGTFFQVPTEELCVRIYKHGDMRIPDYGIVSHGDYQIAVSTFCRSQW